MKKRLITGILLLIMVLSVAFSTEAYDMERAFYKNIYNISKENFVVSYTDSFGFYAPGVLQMVYYDGYLAAKAADMDGDGKDELVAIRIRQDIEEEENVLEAEVYEVTTKIDVDTNKTHNDLDRYGRYTLAQGVLTGDQAEINVFLVPKKKGYYICCEDKEEEAAIYSSMNWTFTIAYYDSLGCHEYQELRVDDDDLKSGIKSAKKLIDKLKLTVKNPITESIASQDSKEQNSKVVRLNIIKRKGVRPTEKLLEHMDSGDGTLFKYGQTLFKSFANEDYENELRKNFSIRFDEDMVDLDEIDDDGEDDDKTVVYPYGAGKDKKHSSAEEDEYDDDDDDDDEKDRKSTSSSGSRQYRDPYKKDYSAYYKEFIFYDSSVRYLSEAELVGLSDYELRIARNEIYARHGRIFNSVDLSDEFNSKSWYEETVPAERFDYAYAQKVFNEIEITNIDLIQAYENSR